MKTITTRDATGKMLEKFPALKVAMDETHKRLGVSFKLIETETPVDGELFGTRSRLTYDLYIAGKRSKDYRVDVPNSAIESFDSHAAYICGWCNSAVIVYNSMVKEQRQYTVVCDETNNN